MGRDDRRTIRRLGEDLARARRVSGQGDDS
jgi:hypothetical protein